MKRDRLVLFPMLLLWPFTIYSIVLFPIFQWKNPKANQMSYFRDFKDVVLLQKLEKYQ